jgi:hypothetical protein
MAMSLRTCLLEASIGALFLIAAALGNDRNRAHADPRMPDGVGAGLLLANKAPATALARAPPIETCRRANRRYRWRGCRESRSGG